MRRALAVLGLVLLPNTAVAEPLNCSVAEYRAQNGLVAALADEVLTLTWAGDGQQELRLRLVNRNGTPTLAELAVGRGGRWRTVAENVSPEFRVATGLRRISNQQLQPLRQLGVEITQAVVDEHRWDAFWDAPLDLDQGEPRRGGNPPPAEGVAGQPGLPRRPTEVRRDTATFQSDSCRVRTDGLRLEVLFPGVRLGIFSGGLQFTVYRGANLIRIEAIAATSEPSVAYKYDAGVTGFDARPGARVVWRDLANQWQEDRLGGAPFDGPSPLKTANRLIAAETSGGAVAVFPPPHTFFWAREVETNLGYSWYRRDGSRRLSIGIRQAEGEEDPRYRANFSLYSARPGTSQRMAVYLYVGAGSGAEAIEGALAFTRGDRYKPLPGYQVMANHFHMDLGERLLEAGSFDVKLPDLQALRAAGITIVSPTDRPADTDRLDVLQALYEGARRHSDEGFLILPAEEVSQFLGGHWDIVFPKPVFWTRDRKPGQPLVEDGEHGRVYRTGSADDVMEMVERERALVFMPHPRTKGSTGYPDVIRDTAHFTHPRYRGVGWRWGMGLDLSERRLSDLRVLPLLDDMSNWMTALGGAPKFIQAITETYRKQPGDDIYANNPVNYVKVDSLPTPDDAGTVVDAMMRGDFFVTSGEVLIPSFEVRGSGARRTVVAEVEWTFPLEFVEAVWGDGRSTGRQIIPATDRPPMGRHRFEIPFDAEGRKWVRFAVWDSAGNGALVQPVTIE